MGSARRCAEAHPRPSGQCPAEPRLQPGNLRAEPATSELSTLLRNAADRVRPPPSVRPARRRAPAVSALARPRGVHRPRRLVTRAVRNRHAAPNITAILHTGQGLNNVIQDVLIRFERMRGREALWLPGTDHAGIATQNVVERLVTKEGKTRFDLGRDTFVERVWRFVRETGSTILEQRKVIGCSCDWSRTRFTCDDAYSRAVPEVFVRLWEEKLIYRGHRVIHWCPHCRTALSDEEAEFADQAGTLYHIRYPVEGGPAPFLTVATTRPETMLGDTAVAVNPKDKRHKGFIGKTARLPIAGLPIPIIGDDA